MTEPDFFEGAHEEKNRDDEWDGWEKHVEELRRRIIAVLVVFFAVALVAFVFVSDIAAFLTAPLARFQVRLYTFAPAEKFMAYLHLAAWTGMVATTPFACLQAALFVWPGLRGHERRYAALALTAVPVLFVAGAAAVYRFFAPLVFGFFLSFAAGDNVTALWGLRQYLGLLAGLMLATGLLLQMPLVLLLLFATGLVSPAAVARARPQVILLIFFLAAAATPPDVVSQVMLGIPLYLLFEATLFAGKRIARSKA